jgi:hypothetical protein
MNLDDKVLAALERLEKRKAEEAEQERAASERLRESYMRRTGRTDYKA